MTESLNKQSIDHRAKKRKRNRKAGGKCETYAEEKCLSWTKLTPSTWCGEQAGQSVKKNPTTTATQYGNS